MTIRRFLITEGNPDREEPELLCAVAEDALEATLRQCAEQVVRDKGDVSNIRVWALTPVEVTTKAFDVLGLEKLKDSSR